MIEVLMFQKLIKMKMQSVSKNFVKHIFLFKTNVDNQTPHKIDQKIKNYAL